MILPFGPRSCSSFPLPARRLDDHRSADLPFGLTLTAEALSKASMIGVRFVLCIGFIVLLSSTTRIQDLLVGARRLGFPSEFTLILGMMTRYLFVFGQLFLRVRNALSTRCFDPFDRSLPYRYRIRQLGNTIGMVFIRSYEQGERTYMAMLCRGYGKDAFLFVPKKPLARSEGEHFSPAWWSDQPLAGDPRNFREAAVSFIWSFPQSRPGVKRRRQGW